MCKCFNSFNYEFFVDLSLVQDITDNQRAVIGINDRLFKILICHIVFIAISIIYIACSFSLPLKGLIASF